MIGLSPIRPHCLLVMPPVDVAAAVDEVAMTTVPANGGQGGLIAVDAEGNTHMSFSTEGMYRGQVRGDGQPEVAIYR